MYKVQDFDTLRLEFASCGWVWATKALWLKVRERLWSGIIMPQLLRVDSVSQKQMSQENQACCQ